MFHLYFPLFFSHGSWNDERHLKTDLSYQFDGGVMSFFSYDFADSSFSCSITSWCRRSIPVEKNSTSVSMLEYRLPVSSIPEATKKKVWPRRPWNSPVNLSQSPFWGGDAGLANNTCTSSVSGSRNCVGSIFTRMVTCLGLLVSIPKNTAPSRVQGMFSYRSQKRLALREFSSCISSPQLVSSERHVCSTGKRGRAAGSVQIEQASKSTARAAPTRNLVLDRIIMQSLRRRMMCSPGGLTSASTSRLHMGHTHRVREKQQPRQSRMRASLKLRKISRASRITRGRYWADSGKGSRRQQGHCGGSSLGTRSWLISLIIIGSTI